MKNLMMLSVARCARSPLARGHASSKTLCFRSLGQEWSAAETSHAHLAEAVQKLSQAYIAAQKKQAETDAYWAKYVAGLTPRRSK